MHRQGGEAVEPMLHKFINRRRLLVLLTLLSIVALVLVGRWLNSTKVGGQQPAEPFAPAHRVCPPGPGHPGDARLVTASSHLGR